MNIIYASSEGYPYIKTGGLGDVVYALPKELSKNNDVGISVFLPLYNNIKNNPDFNLKYLTHFTVQLSWRNLYCGVFTSKIDNVTYYFLDNEYYFNRRLPYGDYDDGEKFAFFSKAILESILKLNLNCDILHCHDWQTALVPIFLDAFYKGFSNFYNTKTVFTIHNIEYQGKMNNTFLYDVLGLSEKYFSILHFDDCLNLMKGAIVLSDKVTTVSKTYAHEIKYSYFAHNLQSIINQNFYKITGIVNGIDTDIYNSKTDINIKYNFDENTIFNKAKNKIYLQQKLGLKVCENIPIISVISRLVSHKGLDLIECVFDEMLSLPVQFVLLGTGDEHFENFFKSKQQKYGDRISINITFDSSLAKEIYSASDFFLMPSKSEPCGLSQLIAMRYGTIPIVRETGGLFDTVTPFNYKTLSGCGFTFKTYNAHDMLNSIKNAISLYNNKEILNTIIKNDLNYDCSWKKSALEYLNLYRQI